MEADDPKAAFEPRLRDLIHAVTKDLLHEDNVQHDLKQAVGGYRRDERRDEQLAAICTDVREEFKSRVFTKTMEHSKMKPVFEKMRESQNHSKGRSAWRLTGNPQHDTFAQRRRVYADHLADLEAIERELGQQLKEKRREIQELIKQRQN
ncbi:hypothetical protein M3Y99_01117400 [Aphelenchoides fujianensis]|nr:hypothetical protein M3Y99_01117400 [Aphelenchoides fujianensis]